MKQSASKKHLLIFAVGVLLMVTGLVLLKSLPGEEGLFQVLPYICIGVGAGALGNGAAGLLQAWILRKEPAAAKRLEIETLDERNVAISDKAKSKAFDWMIYIFGTVLLVFTLLGSDLYVILSLVAVYVLMIAVQMYYVSKFNKEM